MLIVLGILRLLGTLLGIVRLFGMLNALGILIFVCKVGGRERVADVK